MMQNWPRSILIIKLSSIGDVVHTIPALEVLKKTYPHSRIDWLVEEEAAAIIEGHKDLRRIFISKRKAWFRRLVGGKELRNIAREIKDFIAQVRGEEYDLVIDFQGLFKSGLLAWLTKGRRKVGMNGARESSWIFLSERPFQVSYEQHAIDRYLQLCEHLGCNSVGWKGSIPYGDSEKKSVTRLLEENRLKEKRIIAINSMARWETKLWKSSYFAALADKIQEELGCSVVFTGSKGDGRYLSKICDLMRTRGINLAGQTSLKDLAYLYEICSAIVTVDTGPMHIAAAMGCPVVALFGPTDPLRTGPYGEAHTVIRADLECSPCFRKRCNDPRCMGNISVDEVFGAVTKILRH